MGMCTSFIRYLLGTVQQSSLMDSVRLSIQLMSRCGYNNILHEKIRRATKKLSNVLGRGIFSTVYYGTLDDGTRIAIKSDQKLLAGHVLGDILGIFWICYWVLGWCKILVSGVVHGYGTMTSSGSVGCRLS